MSRRRIYESPRRTNILIEESLHAEAAARAKSLGLEGGFSEYVTRLIIADRKRKGRAVTQAQRTAS